MGKVTEAKRNLIGKVTLASVILGSALVGSIAIGSALQLSSAAPANRWPSVVTGHLVSGNEGPYPKSLPFGNVVSRASLAEARRGNGWYSSFSGDVGYALAYLNGFQYPLRTTNYGATWTIDSPYWSGPWADAGRGAVYIDAYSASVAVAYGNQWLYVTTDGGRHWYLNDNLGEIEAVEPPLLEWWVSPALPRNAIIADVAQNGIHKQSGKVVSRAQYLGSDGGQKWTLLPANR